MTQKNCRQQQQPDSFDLQAEKVNQRAHELGATI
jgi:hypothetical protein